MSKLQDDIKYEASKLIRRFETYARQLADETKRRARRTTNVATPLVPKRPAYWDVNDGFNPYIVRSRASRIAHSVQSAVATGAYRPRAAVLYSVPKADGGVRHVSVFQIADNTVSRRLFEGLLSKNRALLSSRAYAYRDDLSVHDAIQYIRAETRGSQRRFIAEYDFSKFFDNISHDHIWRALKDNGFLLSSSEERLIRAFLAAPALAESTYHPNGGTAREVGVPQGTSISLFLANVAAWDLDRALERLGVGFVRYADDTLIWSRSYSQICHAVDELHDISDRIGAPLNFKKSGGVRLLLPAGAPGEFASTYKIDFLGHRIDTRAVALRDSVVSRIKERVTELLYFNLIREPMLKQQNPGRLAGVDRDYVVFIWQLRRYLYGDITEKRLSKMRRRGIPRRRFHGLMSFFPLADDTQQLAELDAWIECHIHLALRKRARLLALQGISTPLPPPHGVATNKLRTLRHLSATTGQFVDLTIPSAERIGGLIRDAARTYGTAVVSRRPKYESDSG